MTRRDMAAILPMKAPDPKRAMIAYFREQYKARTGEEPLFTWETMGGMLKNCKHFKSVDEDTGEITWQYPPIEAWKKEVDAFFADPWAAGTGFKFAALLGETNYGHWRKFSPVAIRRKIVCRECGREGHEAHQCPQRPAPADPEVVREAMAAIKQLGQSMDIRRDK